MRCLAPLLHKEVITRMDEKQTFGELKILQKLNDYEFAFEADILRDGPVQGGRWVFENLREYYKTFAGRPVLVAYIGPKVGDGHNSRDRRDPKTGEVYRSFMDATAERIVGTISEDLEDLTLFEEGGYTWLRVKGRIWAEYAHELVETIMRTGRMSVSIEANVYDVREEDGVEYYPRWEAVGLTVLGQDVKPAVPGANIRALADMEEEFENMKLRVASLVKASEDHETKPQNNPTPKELKQSMIFSKKQLAELQEKFGPDYKVLMARKEGDVTHIALMRKNDFVFCAYDMGEKDSAFYPEKVMPRGASIVLNAAEDGEGEVCAEAGEIICEECAEAEAAKETACAEVKRLSEELASVKSQLSAMQEFETKRRVSAAKEHAKSVLNGYNANRSEKVSETVIASIITDAENGAYTDRMDKDGNWIGLSAVEKDVKALCADEQMKLDAKRAEASKTEFVWRGMAASGSAADDGSPAALIAAL